MEIGNVSTSDDKIFCEETEDNFYRSNHLTYLPTDRSSTYFEINSPAFSPLPFLNNMPYTDL